MSEYLSMRKTLWFLLVVLFLSCSSQITKKQVIFSDGKAGEIEIVVEKEPEKVLHVTFKNDGKVVREKEVFDQVEKIWEAAKTEAEEKEIKEGLIKYIYLSDFDEKKKEPIYKVILFEAAKIESGDWTIRKVS